MSQPLPTPPKRNLLQWALANPGAIEEYLQRVVALSKLEIVVRRPNGTTRIPIEFSGQNAVASLPPIELEAGTSSSSTGTGAGGNVFGPATSTPENLAAFFDESGKKLKDAGASLADIDPRGLHSLWIPAETMRPSAIGGCAPLATIALEIVIDGGTAADEFADVIDGGAASDEFPDIIDGNPI